MKTPIVYIAVSLLLLASSAVAQAQFGFSEVRGKAQALAAKPFQPPTNRLPEALKKLSYIEHQAIQFNHSNALWKNAQLPFEIEFFHPGYFYKEVVALHEISEQGVRQIPFKSEFFNYGTNHLELPADPGFAGFRVVSPVNEFGEVAAFAGASYFRMVGRGQNYGTSGRGLALNTASQGGEEFPVFTEYWLQKPAKRDTTLTFYALLDSPSVAGAYQFKVHPGIDTVATVKAALFPRREVKEFGVAPLTSMFLHGKNGRAMFNDFRPEVHDADGLLVHNGRGEWIWHSLDHGKMMRVNTFSDERPQGFGLMQRERDFEQYQDLVARFQRRPSVWVKPLSDWGKGAVELVQLPSDKEFFDNIVAFWVPATPPKPGDAASFQYELHWTMIDPAPATLGHVVATRVGRVLVEPPKSPPNLRFVIDFGGSAVESLSGKEQLAAQIEYGEEAAFIADSLLKNDINGTWRLVIEIAEPRKAVDLRAYLKRREQRITEVWTFTWQP